MYLRFLATQAKVFAILTVFTSLVLYPTYITASNRYRPIGDPLRAVGIEIVSLANVPDKSPRLWVTLVSEIFVVTTFCWFLYQDIRMFTLYRTQYRSSPTNPSNYAVIVQDIPKRYCSKQHVYATFDRIFPSQVVDVHLVRDAAQLEALKRKYLRAVKRREHAEHRLRKRLALDDASNEASDKLSVSREFYAQDRRVAFWGKRQLEYRAKIAEAEQDLDQVAPLTQAAFVIFRSKKTATFAATAPVWDAGNRWEISRAAEPRGVLWNRLSISRYTEKARVYISFTVLMTMTILWAVPASLIQAMGNFEEIAAQFEDSFITDIVEGSPEVVRFLEGFLPPLFLYLALWIVPFVVRFVIRFERIHSRVVYESKVRNYVFFFYVMSNFTYVVIIGSALSRFKELWERPTRIVSLLSTSVPAQATFLMNYVVINSFVGSTVGLLNHGRLLVQPFAMLRAKTEREKQEADMIFTQYPFAKMYAVCGMIGFISFVYSTIGPLICVVALVYFCLAYACTKQLLLYSHRGRWEGGGYLFRDAWTGMLGGLFVHQLSMIAIFSLKRATVQAVLGSLSFVASALFTRYCRRNFLSRAKHGSVRDQVQGSGDAEDLEDVWSERFAKLYVHPGLMDVEELEKMEDEDEACEARMGDC